MEPIIHHISSTDWNGREVEHLHPKVIAVCVEIGEFRKSETSNYQLLLCNSMWVEKSIAEKGSFVAAQTIVMDVFSIDTLKNAISQLIEVHGPYNNIIDFSHKLAPYMDWEMSGMEDEIDAKFIAT